MNPLNIELLLLSICDVIIAYYFYKTKNGIVRKIIIAHFLFLAINIWLQLAGIENVWTEIPRLATAFSLAAYIVINKKYG